MSTRLSVGVEHLRLCLDIDRRDEDRERPWHARIRVNGNLLHLGCYKTEREAYNVYREELDKIEMGAGL